MSLLDTRVPPPLVALVVAAGMWRVADSTTRVPPLASLRALLAIGIAIVGIGIAAAGSSAFRRAGTTIDPLRPERASALVSAGVYRFTRNPMYLGLALVLVAFSVYLGSLPALLGLPLFVAYIGRFQIAREEHVLEDKFGAAFAAYKQRVRRWL